MSVDPDLQKLLAPMAEREVSLGGPGFRVDRARVLARMARAGGGGSRGWRVFFAVAGLAALALVAGLRLWPREASSAGELDVTVLEGSATQARAGATAAVPSGRSARVAADGELATADGSRARVRTPEGLELELGGRTRVGVGELRASGRRVTLLGGAIRCTVPHRADARAFEVVTADVTVVDLGTVFTVAVDEAGRATRVSVEEGEILVRHATGQTRVRAPNAWSREAAAAEAPAPAPAARAATPPTSPAKRAPAIARAPRGDEPPPGTLDQESRLLRAGLAAERQGRPEDAIAALRELLAKYPRSPLANDARGALARVEAGARR